MSNQYSTHDLDHLGIVAGVCQHIGLIGQIDARVLIRGGKSAWDKRCNRWY